MTDILQRIKERVQIDPKTGCWLWTGTKKPNGYGDISIGGKSRLLHRVMWEETYGPIPGGLCVCHTCDVKHCCSPSHLFLGTYKDNMQDAATKGRMASGDRQVFRAHPEKKLWGDKNGARLRPDRLARGSSNGSCLHPEKLARGEGHGNAVLTEQQVREIRDAYAAGGVFYWQLAAKYGTGYTTILKVVQRQTWRHIA